MSGVLRTLARGWPPRSPGRAAGPVRGSRPPRSRRRRGDGPGRPGQVGGEVVEGEIGQFETGGPDQRGTGLLDGLGELAAPTGQYERERGGVEHLQGRTPQTFRDLVEAVQDRQYEIGVDQGGGQRRPVGGPAGEMRVVAHQPVDQPVPQRDGRGIPGADAEDHRHPVVRLPAFQLVQDEPDRQDRLAGSGPAEDDEPPGPDPPVDLGHAAQIAAQVHSVRRRSRRQTLNVLRMVGQRFGGVLPAHRKRKRVVHPAVFLLTLPAAPDFPGQFGGGGDEFAVNG